LTGLEFRSSKGTAVWPEEELEDSVCDVTCAVVTVILRVQELIVVTSTEDPINRFNNPNPRLRHWHVTISCWYVINGANAIIDKFICCTK
jgi:hypothetical protein